MGTCRDFQGSDACFLSAVQACIRPCGKHIIQSSELRGKRGGRCRNLGQMGEDGWASDPKGANTSPGEK